MDADTKKEFMSLLPELFAVIKNKLNLQTTPKIVLKKDIENSENILGKTAITIQPIKVSLYSFLIVIQKIYLDHLHMNVFICINMKTICMVLVKMNPMMLSMLKMIQN